MEQYSIKAGSVGYPHNSYAIIALVGSLSQMASTM